MSRSNRCVSCMKIPVATFGGADKYCHTCTSLVCNPCVAVGRFQGGNCDSCRRNTTVKCHSCFSTNNSTSLRCMRCHVALPRRGTVREGAPGSFLPPVLGGGGSGSADVQGQRLNQPPPVVPQPLIQSCAKCFHRKRDYDCSDCKAPLCNFCTRGSQRLCHDCVQRRVANINSVDPGSSSSPPPVLAGGGGSLSHLSSSTVAGLEPQYGQPTPRRRSSSPSLTPPNAAQPPRPPPLAQNPGYSSPNTISSSCGSCSHYMRSGSYVCRRCNKVVCLNCLGGDSICAACKTVPLPHSQNTAGGSEPNSPATHHHQQHQEGGSGGYLNSLSAQSATSGGSGSALSSHHGGGASVPLAPPSSSTPLNHPPPQAMNPSYVDQQSPSGSPTQPGGVQQPVPPPVGTQTQTPHHLRYCVPTVSKLVMLPHHGNVTVTESGSRLKERIVTISLKMVDIHSRFGRVHGELVMIPDGTERRAEIIGIAGNDLIWLLEGEPKMSVADQTILDFLAEEPAQPCPRCLWSIPTRCIPHHSTVCAVAPPTTQEREAYHIMLGATNATKPPPAAAPSQDDQPPLVGVLVGNGDVEEKEEEENKEEEQSDTAKYASFIQGDDLEPGTYTNIVNVELLGQGAQGRVFKATALDPSGRQALIVTKEISYPSKEETAYLKHVENVKEQKTLKHTHLIRYVDVGFDSNPKMKQHTITILMPYYKESDLNNFLRLQEKPLVEYTVCSLVLQIANALRYLHDKNIAHLDIKPDNVLMFDNCQRTLLMDLDTARNMGTTPAGSPAGVSSTTSPNGVGGRAGLPLHQPGNLVQAKTMVGTMEYMAPEVASGHGYGLKCDIWSLGVVLFDLMVLPEFPMLPLQGRDTTLACPDWTMEALFHAVGVAVANHTNRAKAKPYTKVLYSLVCTMLDHNPSRRPSAGEVCGRLEQLMTQLILGEA